MAGRKRLVIVGLGLAILVAISALWITAILDRTRHPERPKTTAALLVGTWIITKHDPPMPSNITATDEFRADGTNIIRLTESRRGSLPPLSGLYQLKGDTIRFDSEDAENPGGPLQTWNAKIEMITNHTLILVGIDGVTKRVEYKRQLVK